MPALFCFKRSRSSLEGGHPRAPRAMTRGSSSPALSGKPTSPRLALAKVKFGSSPSNMCAMSEPADAPLLHATTHYLIAVHRKQCRADAYFMGWGRSRPAVFGVPLVVAVHDGMTGRQLHAALWTQLARLLSARPPAADLNHATDCDDSLGYEFPFSVRAVRAGDGAWCALCAWPALCRGCLLPNDDTPLLLHAAPAAAAPAAEDVSEGEEARADGEDSSVDSGALCMEARPHGEGVARRVPLGAVELMLAVDWEPTALHLRYSSAHERALLEHASVRGGEARPASLASCLRSFTRPERLEQRYHCARCRALQPATKTLQIWRLPPILVIHLKRFQYVNDKWIKSQKVVNFPFHEFDPTEFLAAVPQETILRHREQHAPPDPAARSDDSDTDDNTHVNARRRRLQSTSLASTPVTADNLEDYHRHHLLPNNDPLDLHYTLYAVVCHSGQLSGGHYVAYARNPSGAWLCYNDSMCRALPSSPPPIDPAAAYLLFYERRGLDYDRYLPDVSRLPPAAAPPAPSPALALRANTCALT